MTPEEQKNSRRELDDLLTPADALEDPDDESEDTVTAIREAIQEMDAGGPGIPLDEFVRKFEAKHGLSRAP